MIDLGLEKQPYKGLRFYDLTYDVKPVVNATFALNYDEKAVLRGKLSFDRHENSWMYNDEVVISLWSHTPPKIEARAESNTKFRLEIPVPLLSFAQMCAVAQERIWNYKTRMRAEALPEITVKNLADLL